MNFKIAKFRDTFSLRLLIGFLYSLLFYYGYIHYLNHYFAYAGFDLVKDRIENGTFEVITLLICIVPLFSYRSRHLAISNFLSVFVYYILYVPIIITFFLGLEETMGNIIGLEILFMLGMSLLFFASRFHLNVITFPSKLDLFKVILVLSILCSLYIAFTYRNNLKLVSFDKVYDQRFANEDLGSGVITRYLSTWLSKFMLPICLAFGLFSKKRVYFIVGTIGCIIIYMATASKSQILLPIITFLLYRLLKNKSLNHVFVLLGLSISFLLVIGLAQDFNFFNSILWSRTIGFGGMLTMKYHDFFLTHPITYYSHINLVNGISNMYPYHKDIGQVVGSFYWSEKMNANANFWATDGFAALGSVGIIFSSIIMFFILVIFNSISKKYNSLFLLLILLPCIMSFLNTSVFSSLWSGGAIFIFLTLSFSTTKNNKYIIK